MSSPLNKSISRMDVSSVNEEKEQKKEKEKGVEKEKEAVKETEVVKEEKQEEQMSMNNEDHLRRTQEQLEEVKKLLLSSNTKVEKTAMELQKSQQQVLRLTSENEQLSAKVDSLDTRYGQHVYQLEAQCGQLVDEERAKVDQLRSLLETERMNGMNARAVSVVYKSELEEWQKKTDGRIRALHEICVAIADKLEIGHLDFVKNYSMYYNQPMAEVLGTVGGDSWDSSIGTQGEVDQSNGTQGQLEIGDYPTFVRNSSLPDDTRSDSMHASTTIDLHELSLSGNKLPMFMSDETLRVGLPPPCNSTGVKDQSIWESMRETNESMRRPLYCTVPPVPEAWAAPPGGPENTSLPEDRNDVPVTANSETVLERNDSQIEIGRATVCSASGYLKELVDKKDAVLQNRTNSLDKKNEDVTVTPNPQPQIDKKLAIPKKKKQDNASPEVREWIAEEAQSYPNVWKSGIATTIRLESFRSMAVAFNTLPFRQFDRSGDDLFQIWKGIQRTVDTEAETFNKKRRLIESQEGKTKKEKQEEVEMLMQGTTFVKRMLYYLRYLVQVDCAKDNAAAGQKSGDMVEEASEDK